MYITQAVTDSHAGVVRARQVARSESVPTEIRARPARFDEFGLRDQFVAKRPNEPARDHEGYPTGEMPQKCVRTRQ